MPVYTIQAFKQVITCSDGSVSTVNFTNTSKIGHLKKFISLAKHPFGRMFAAQVQIVLNLKIISCLLQARLQPLHVQT